MTEVCDICRSSLAEWRVRLSIAKIPAGKWATQGLLRAAEVGVVETMICDRFREQAVRPERRAGVAGALLGVPILALSKENSLYMIVPISLLLAAAYYRWWPDTPAAMNSVMQAVFANQRTKLAIQFSLEESELRPNWSQSELVPAHAA